MLTKHNGLRSASQRRSGAGPHCPGTGGRHAWPWAGAQTTSLRSKATAFAGPSQGKQARNPAFAYIWKLLKTLQLWLLWGSYHHYQLRVCLSSKQEQYARARNKTITKQMRQMSESVFPLSSSHLPNAHGSLVAVALLSWVGDQHQPHQMAERD